MWLLLYNGSCTNGRDPSIFYTLSEQFDHELHLIWAGPPIKKCHDNEANINTRTVTLLAHNSRGSSCIMAHGQMEGIHLFFILFLNSLNMNYTTSNLASYLEVVLGRTKYHHQNGDITNTQFMWLLLYHGSWTNGRDPSIFYTLSEQFDHKSHYFKIGQLPRSDIRTHKISSPRWRHC
jgi:hypothetical protein